MNGRSEHFHKPLIFIWLYFWTIKFWEGYFCVVATIFDWITTFLLFLAVPFLDETIQLILVDNCLLA